MLRFLSYMVNFFMPQQCLGCQAPMPAVSVQPVCDACRSGLRPYPAPLYETPSVSIRAVLCYEGLAVRLVHLFKYRGLSCAQKILRGIVGQYLREHTALYNRDRFDYICPVPLHWLKYIKRGFNQSAVIAGWAGECLRPVPVAQCLRKNRYTHSQTRLTREMRRVNVHRSISLKKNWKERLRGKNVLIVDDICTTSSTLKECIRVIRSARARQVHCLVIAHGK